MRVVDRERGDTETMSKIVSPYPVHLPGEDYEPPAGAAWWRFRLRPNADGNVMLMQTDGDLGNGMDTATWCSWEFFDGETTTIDTGLDRVLPVVWTTRGPSGGWLDVLHVGPPTPSPYWERLPIPPLWPYPEADLLNAKKAATR